MTSAWRAVLASALLFVALSMNGATAWGSPTQSDPAHDTVTVTGYNFELHQPADVVVGSPDSAVKVSFNAGEPLSDATVELVLPRPTWSTKLHPVEGLTGSSPFSPADRASVSLLFALGRLDEPDPAQSCTGPNMGGLFSTADLSVEDFSVLQVVKISHVSCRPNTQLVVRLKGIMAPSRIGTANVFAFTRQHGVLLGVATGGVRVVPRPRVSLRIEGPGSIELDQPSFIAVEAVGPDGAPDPSYRGQVALASIPDDCTLQPVEGTVAATFIGQPGVIAITVDVSTGLKLGRRLVAYDVANRAVAGVSGQISVTGPVHPVVCPASFH